MKKLILSSIALISLPICAMNTVVQSKKRRLLVPAPRAQVRQLNDSTVGLKQQTLQKLNALRTTINNRIEETRFSLPSDPTQVARSISQITTELTGIIASRNINDAVLNRLADTIKTRLKYLTDRYVGQLKNTTQAFLTFVESQPQMDASTRKYVNNNYNKLSMSLVFIRQALGQDRLYADTLDEIEADITAVNELIE